MTDSPRESALIQFLSTCGLADAQRFPMSGDASFRRYERIVLLGKKYILMDAPPPKEDVRPFVHVARWLTAQGFSAPTVLQADEAQGFLLLEDLGDDRFSRVLMGNTQLPHLPTERDMYALAVDTLTRIGQAPLPELPPYSNEVYLREAMLMLEWYLPMITGEEAPAQLLADYKGLWEQAFPSMVPEKPVVVLRDYHADNLMWLPTREGTNKVGLLDFQDALIGHAAYDLLSLLEDARREVAPILQREMKEHFMQGYSGGEKENFLSAYSAIAAQRNLKIIGIFARLAKRDKKPVYLPLIPRVWRHLEQDLQHPVMANIRKLVDHTFPEGMRRTVPVFRGA